MKLDRSLQRITVIFLSLLLAGGTSALHAQTRAGAGASPQLKVPLGAQYLDGSGAAAGVSGIAGVLWNPAGLDRGEGDIKMMLTRREHIADIGVNFLAVGASFEKIGTFALHIRNFDIGEIEETDEFNMDGTGGTFEPTFVTVGATYSLGLTEKITVGVTSNVTNESFADVSATNVTFDAGVQYRNFLTIQGLDIGVSARNIGTPMKYGGSGLINQGQQQGTERPSTQLQVVPADADVPTTMDLSFEYNAWRGLSVQATYSENTYKPSEVKGQLAYNFRDLVTVRGSYTLNLEDRGVLESPYQNRPSFGGTLNLESALGVPVSFDYAFVSAQYFENNHILSLRGRF